MKQRKDAENELALTLNFIIHKKNDEFRTIVPILLEKKTSIFILSKKNDEVRKMMLVQ